MSRRKIVLLLGNGFSQGFKFPSMEELWDKCLEPSEDRFEDFLSKAKSTYPLSYFSAKQIKNFELLLTCWKAYGEALERYGKNRLESTLGYYENYIQNLNGWLHRILGENELELAVRHGWFKRLIKNADVRFVTTNYDLVIEKIIHNCNGKYHFFASNHESVPIRKLHGSIAWFPFQDEAFQMQINAPELILQNNGEYVYDFSKDFFVSKEVWQLYVQFSQKILDKRRAVIIPPLIGKEYNYLFEQSKKDLYDDFTNFDILLVIGYSFPEADPIIREAILDACKNNYSKDSRIICINSSSLDLDRIQMMFGKDYNFESINSQWDMPLLAKYFPEYDPYAKVRQMM